MNPLFQAMMGNSARPAAPMTNPSSTMPNAGFGGVFGRAQQIANAFSNPQQIVQQYFPDAPAEMRNDPEQLIGWLQQTGRVNPQMVQMARQLMGR